MILKKKTQIINILFQLRLKLKFNFPQSKSYWERKRRATCVFYCACWKFLKNEEHMWIKDNENPALDPYKYRVLLILVSIFCGQNVLCSVEQYWWGCSFVLSIQNILYLQTPWLFVCLISSHEVSDKSYYFHKEKATVSFNSRSVCFIHGHWGLCFHYSICLRT